MEVCPRPVLWMAIAAILLSSAGCGVTRRAAISAMVPILERTVGEVYRDQDIETVRRGIPANLLLIRGLCESDPRNDDLWSLAAQLYFYYAVGFIEDEDRARATLIYSRGMALGKEALSRKRWFDTDQPIDRFVADLRSAKRKDVPLLFWTLANWTKSISLRQNDPSILAELPYAEAALTRVLELDPTYFHGMPHLMIGTLEATMPVLAGGDPEAARAHFEAAFAISGRKLLIFHVFYAEHYCRRQLDEEGFDAALEEVLQAPPDLEPNFQLLNEVARRKAKALVEQKDDLF